MLAGGVLQGRRSPLGYVVGAGLLFQFGLTQVALAAILAASPALPEGRWMSAPSSVCWCLPRSVLRPSRSSCAEPSAGGIQTCVSGAQHCR